MLNDQRLPLGKVAMMIGTKGLRWIVVGMCAVALTGCRVKSLESFQSAVTESPATPGKGDPYAYGGIAEGSGGLQPRSSYASDDRSSDPLGRTETGKAGRLEVPRVDVGSGANTMNVQLDGAKRPQSAETPPQGH
jgi:hypothetical protein